MAMSTDPYVNRESIHNYGAFFLWLKRNYNKEPITVSQALAEFGLNEQKVKKPSPERKYTGRKPRKEVTEQDAEEMRRLFREGMDVQPIADKMEFSYAAVASRIPEEERAARKELRTKEREEAQLAIRPKEIEKKKREGVIYPWSKTPEEIAEINRLYNSGLSVKKVAKALGFAESTIKNHVKNKRKRGPVPTIK